MSGALRAIAPLLDGNPWKDVILSGLRLVMENNYFTFGDTCWQQLRGTAMGTPVAPAFASLYVSAVEDILLDEYCSHILYYKRYIDDIFVLWTRDDATSTGLHQFLAEFSQRSSLILTHTTSSTDAVFLDLCIVRDGSTVYTRTHQKSLNLYLYIPANSAHPPGVLKGLVIGLVRKYRKQNTRPRDFRKIVKLLYKRLLDRGYTSSTLQPLFRRALTDSLSSTSRPVAATTAPIVFKLPYDPNGLSRARLRHLLSADELEQAIGTQIKICFLKPPSLKTLLCPRNLRQEAPSLATLLLTDRTGGRVYTLTPNPYPIH